MGALIQGGEESFGRERMEAPSKYTPIPSQEAITCERGGKAVGRSREVGGGSKMAGGCGKVSVIIANPTVGPDGCRGQAICFRSGGSSDLPWEANTLEGIPLGWKGKEDQEVLAWHSCSLRDPVVPKKH